MVTRSGIVLTYGPNDKREPGRIHYEFNAPCGCAFHERPAPHWHPCPTHTASPPAAVPVAGERERVARALCKASFGNDFDDQLEPTKQTYLALAEEAIAALRASHQPPQAEPPVLDSLRADNRRLRMALRGYHKHDPQDCADAPCVSHMAYNELVALVESEGYRWNDEAETWTAVGAQAAEQGEPVFVLVPVSVAPRLRDFIEGWAMSIERNGATAAAFWADLLSQFSYPLPPAPKQQPDAQMKQRRGKT